MAESGHVNNIANFGTMRENAVAMGAGYAPTNALITVAGMGTLHTTASGAQDAMLAGASAARVPINEREELFGPLDKLVTRSLNYFKSTGATAQVIADAKGLCDRFRGSKLNPRNLPDGTPDPDHVSNAHLGFVQKTETFAQLVALYGSDANYAPGGGPMADLTVAALQAKLVAMKAANVAVDAVLAPLMVARAERDKALYEAGTGIYDVQNKVKAYVKGAYGATSAEAKMFTRLKFTRPKRR
jgi:hypothetical protein